MKKFSLITALLISVLSLNSYARDDIAKYSVPDLLKTTKAQDALLDVPLFFASQAHKEVEKTYGEVSTNKKTNAFMKSDEEACQWAMLSALKALQERAIRENMDAVVNIKSNYKKRKFVSETQFECGAGAVMAGVALKGTLVKFKSE
ncbi:excinuclease ABC subunit A [Litorilituus lipolyticus]|uniref:Excinuclease ABC subunit A n=1 Tax=Litorilituus lipolyticus TaxID=2491017 RepID=A0A502KQZ5_9GAMM|nr:excinuclease ABC subunit A [Litorilituus lipolyticus]TPH13916.1 excinuclease ABC subunit A [Litorilituus lipolyticus]